jgi:Tol biopolymer transport system component
MPRIKALRTSPRSWLAFAVVGALTLGLAPLSAPADATTPGTNGRLAFAMDVTGDGAQIYSIDANGTGLTQLTTIGGNASSPDWSPDGARIAFGVDEAGLFVMNADGSGLHQIASFGGQPAFTPDGHHVVYECGECDGGDGVFLMLDDGSNAPGLRLTANPFVDEGDSNPEVSPDGQTVTFVRHQVEGELQALFAVGIDGSGLRQLTTYELEVGVKHDWSPDGQRIALIAHADFPGRFSPNVATIAADGSDLRMLTRYQGGGVGAFTGSYSPDGQYIAYRKQSRGGYELWRISADGRSRKLIASFEFSPRFIDWGSAA